MSFLLSMYSTRRPTHTVGLLLNEVEMMFGDKSSLLRPGLPLGAHCRFRPTVVYKSLKGIQSAFGSDHNIHHSVSICIRIQLVSKQR